MRALLVLTAAIVLAGAGRASAATVAVGNFNTTTYTAAAGEANNLTTTVSGANYLFDDVVVVTAGNGCTQSGDDALCPTAAASTIDVFLDDQNDTFHSDVAQGFWRVHGAAGSDTLDSPRSANFLFGEAGDDTLIGDTSSDSLVGGAGADTIDGGPGTDVVDYYNETPARPGNVNVSLDGVRNDGDPSATAYDGAALDLISNVEGIRGGNGNDTLTGDGILNDLDGNGGNDVINGLGGNDPLNGRDGNDILNGGDGDDTLIGGRGADQFNGDSGTDLADFSLDSRPNGVTVTLDGVQNDGDQTAANFDTAARDNVGGVEKVNGTFDADTLTGDAGANTFTGNGGADTLDGGDGADVLSGGPGADALFGGIGAAADKLTGGAGPDRFDVDAAGNPVADLGIDRVLYNDHVGGVTLTVGDGAANDGDATDDVAGVRDNIGPDVDSVTGSNGADVITGSPVANNTLYGAGGNDTLSGGDGADFLAGGAGNDAFHGGAGSDKLTYHRAGSGYTTSGGVRVDNDDVADDGVTGETDNVFGDIETVYGSEGADTIDLSFFDGVAPDGVSIVAFGLNDTLKGTAGNDFFDGGSGTDSANCVAGTDQRVSIETPNANCT